MPDFRKLLEGITPDLFQPASKDELASRPPEQFPFPNDAAGVQVAEELVDEVNRLILTWYEDPDTGYGRTMEFDPHDSEFLSEMTREFTEGVTALFKVWQERQKKDYGTPDGE